MHFLSNLVALAAIVAPAVAHMEMSNPPPLRSKFNPNVAEAQKDFNMISPLNADGSNFPCKGSLGDIGTPGGASVVTYKAGSAQTFEIVGGAVHNGGSGQISLSYDKGQTFKVVKTFLGNFPRSDGGNAASANQVYNFDVPANAPSGEAVLAWTWFNEVGNREMYMNCAVVTVEGGSGSLDDLPDMFVANVGNGCSTTEGTDLNIPNPGANVETADGKKLGEPVGSCAAGGSTPNNGGTPPDVPTTNEPTTPDPPTETAAPAPAPPSTTDTVPAPPQQPTNNDPCPDEHITGIPCKDSPAFYHGQKRRVVSSRFFGVHNSGVLYR